MYALPACMSVEHMCAWYPRRPEESVRSPGTRVINRLWCRSVLSHHVGAMNEYEVPSTVNPAQGTAINTLQVLSKNSHFWITSTQAWAMHASAADFLCSLPSYLSSSHCIRKIPSSLVLFWNPKFTDFPASLSQRTTWYIFYCKRRAEPQISHLGVFGNDIHSGACAYHQCLLRDRAWTRQSPETDKQTTHPHWHLIQQPCFKT